MKEVYPGRRSGHTMSAVFCGLDVHKESTYATVLDSTGQVVTQRRMKNEDIPEFLEPLQVNWVAMEASTYIIPLYRRLVEEGYSVTVSHPKKTRYIAEARIKSDRVDSKALAELLRLDSLPESYIPPEELAELRERIRRRAFLVRQRAKLKVKIRDVLAYEGVKPPTGHGLFTRKGVKWLRGLGLEPVDCYLRLMAPLSREVLLLSKELRGIARDSAGGGGAPVGSSPPRRVRSRWRARPPGGAGRGPWRRSCPSSPGTWRRGGCWQGLRGLRRGRVPRACRGPESTDSPWTPRLPSPHPCRRRASGRTPRCPPRCS